jgi:hypothetical protein
MPYRTQKPEQARNGTSAAAKRERNGQAPTQKRNAAREHAYPELMSTGASHA